MIIGAVNTYLSNLTVAGSINASSNGVIIANGTPTSTSNTLYNVNGTLYFSGSAVGNSFTSQTQNTVFAAPATANGLPTFRTLTAWDLPGYGTASFTATIGDGTNATINVIHNLGVTDVNVSVFELGGSKRKVDAGIDIRSIDLNTIQLVFTNPPDAASLRVIVFSSGALGSLTQFSQSNPGVVPASTGGTINFLRADGSWVNPLTDITASTAITMGALTATTGSFSSTTSVSSGGLNVNATPGQDQIRLQDSGVAKWIIYSPTTGTFALYNNAQTVNALTIVGSTGAATFTGTLSASNLSNTNTGDETLATIKTKLGITTLSGSNTGDQDLSGYALKSGATFTGTVTAPTLAINANVNITASGSNLLPQINTPSGWLAMGASTGNLTLFATGQTGGYSFDKNIAAANFSGSHSGTSSGTNTGDQTLSGLGGQAALNGTGFVKASGTTISYDNTAYYPNSNPNSYTGNLGTVTDVAPLTLGTSGTDVSSTVATRTTTPVITLNIPTASATNRGALSAADWTTFNNKQASGAYLTSVVPSNFASQTANTVLAAPNGSAGVPTFRALVAADIPTLNQATTAQSGSVANSLITKFDSGTTEGTDLYTYNGSAAKTINFIAGTNITLTKAAGSITITGGIPTATASVLGGVKPDGTTITNTAGVISVTYGNVANTAAQGNDVRLSDTRTPSNDSNLVHISGTETITGTKTFSSDLTISGNLTVNGTTVTINSTTLSVDDKNIELGSVTTPTNATADGGGITLKGTTDKTLNWVSSTAAWTSSEGLDLASGKTYKIVGTDVLSATTLGSGVVNSSLTSVGTIATGTWNATAIADAKIASALTGKTYNALTLTAQATGFTIAGGTTSKTLTLNGDATLSGANTGDQTLSSLGGQAALNGTGFVKVSGTTISYDNSTYITSASAVGRTEYRNFGSVAVNPNAGNDVTCTTAQFITWLTTLGVFNYSHSVMKCTWNYAGNNDISDTGFGANLELAGSVIEVFIDGASYYTIKITRPTTGSMPGGDFIYNCQGSGYSPGWRQVWNSSTLTNLNQLTNGPSYLTTSGSAASLTNFPTLNQNTTGSAGSLAGGSITINSAIYINTGSPTIYLQDTDERSAMIHCNSATFYILRGSAANSTSWATANGYWPFEINLNTNNATFGGNVSAPVGEMYATKFALPYNTISTLWGSGYGGALQVLSDNGTATRWARLGIVDSTGAWQGGLTIANSLAATFGGTISATNFSGSSSGTNTGDQTLPTLSSLGGQAALNGTGFVKASGTTISYDNTSYAALSGASFTGDVNDVNNTITAAYLAPCIPGWAKANAGLIKANWSDSVNIGMTLQYRSAGTLYDGIVLNQTGKVGIGITPTYYLDLTAPAIGSGRQGLVNLLHSGNNTFSIDAFGASSSVTPSTIQLSATNAEQNISIISDTSANAQAGGSTKGLFIKGNGGNVGIGKTSPLAKLDVMGELRISNTTATGGDYDNYPVRIVSYYDGNSMKIFGNAGNEYFGVYGYSKTVLGLAGNVGIGTTTPTNKFVVQGGSSAMYSGNHQYFYSDAGANAHGDIYDDGNFHITSLGSPVWINSATGNAIYLNQQANGNVILATGGGSVGINTASPSSSYKLDVVGDTRTGTITTSNIWINSGASFSGLNIPDMVPLVFQKDFQQDMFAFNAPTTYETYNGSTWTSTTVPTGIFTGRASNAWSGLSIPQSVTQVRMTWNNFGYRFWDMLTLVHSTNGNSFTATLQWSTDGVTWTSYWTTPSYSSWPGYSTFRSSGNNSGQTPQLRLILTCTQNNANTINIGHIGLMGTYGGFNRLYDWDYARNISTYGNITVNSGNGSIYTGDLYAASWLRLSGSKTGLYHSGYGTHFYANDASYWRVSSNYGMMFNSTTVHDSAPVGQIYHDGGGFGLMNDQGGWSVKCLQGASYGGALTGNWALSSGTTGSTATPTSLSLPSNFSNGYTRDKLKLYLYNSGTEQYGFTTGPAGDIQHHSNGTHDFYVANTKIVSINSTTLTAPSALFSGSGIADPYLVLGSSSIPTWLCRDSNTRSAISTSGSYPIVNLHSTVGTGNTNHGSTIQFNGVGSTTQFVIGTDGGMNQLDIGYALSPNAYNPHYGIASYPGSGAGPTIIRIKASTGYIGIGGSWGTWGAVGDPAYPVDLGGNTNVRGSITATSISTPGSISLTNANGHAISFDYSSWTRNAVLSLENTFDLLIQGHSNIYFRTNHLNGSTINRLTVTEALSTFLTNGGLRVTRESNTDQYVTIQGGDGNGKTTINGTYDISLQTQGSDRLFVQRNTGNVGIGTTTPGYKLDINGNARVMNLLQINSGSYPSSYATQLYSNGSAAGILVFGNNSTNEIRFGNTAVGGYGNFYVNNTADATAVANGSLALTLAANMNATFYGNITAPQVHAIWNGVTGGAALTTYWGGYNTTLWLQAGSSYDFGILNPAQTSWIMQIPTGTSNVIFGNIVYASDFSASSDQRLKTNITPLTDALDKIKQLNGVTFNWNELSKYDQTTEQVGVLAQEVEKVLPQAVSKGEEYMSVSYGKIVPLLIESIKEQQSEIDELKSLVKQLLKEK